MKAQGFLAGLLGLVAVLLGVLGFNRVSQSQWLGRAGGHEKDHSCRRFFFEAHVS